MFLNYTSSIKHIPRGWNMCTNTSTMICKMIRCNFAIPSNIKNPITKWTNVCTKHWLHKSQGIIDQTKKVYNETFNLHFSMLLICFFNAHFLISQNKKWFLVPYRALSNEFFFYCIFSISNQAILRKVW